MVIVSYVGHFRGEIDVRTWKLMTTTEIVRIQEGVKWLAEKSLM